jgi:hypothetical protein
MYLRIETGNPNDPISVRGSTYTIELRIGRRRRGETRYARLTGPEAREIAKALLTAAKGYKGLTED